MNPSLPAVVQQRVCIVYPYSLPAPTAAARTGAARKASVEVITSARVTSVTYQGENPAEDPAPNAGGGDSFSETQLQQQQQQKEQARFELSFTTATPLPPDVRKALGAEAAEAAAATTEEEAPGSTTGGAGGGGAAESNAGASSSSSTSSSASGKSKSRSSYRISCDFVLQATGAAREGHGWAKRLGHTVSAPVPSLFTLTVKDPR